VRRQSPARASRRRQRNVGVTRRPRPRRRNSTSMENDPPTYCCGGH
jgi:hypothetical protein